MYRGLIVLLITFTFIPIANAKSSEVRCLTDMAYMENKSGGKTGIKDVVDVMFNRVDSKHFPSGICSNLYMKGQYPWAGKIIPNRKTTTYKEVEKIVEEEYAKRKLGAWRDGTDGSLFFNNHGKKPTKKVKRVMTRKGHHFFKL